MDASLANDINRRDARLMAEYLDRYDAEYLLPGQPEWAESITADMVMTDNPEGAAARAWFVGTLGARTPGVYFDGAPADCDWDNLYSHLRAEIAARRAPQPPSVRAPEMTGRAGVV